MTNIAGFDFDAWLKFLVNENPPDQADSSNWLYKWEHLEVIRHSSELFRRSGEIWHSLGNEKLTKVLSTVKANFLPMIVHPTIPPEVATECVRNMWQLFADVFSHDPLGSSCVLWFWPWPTIHYTGSPQGLEVYDAVDEAIFALLTKLLAQNQNREVRRSALHGLSYRLDRARVRTIIEQFLKSQPDLDDELRQYAERCKEGGVV